MKKSEFQKLINDNKDIFRGIFIKDSTLTCNSKHISIYISWKGFPFNDSIVKNMRGTIDDVHVIEEYNKYKNWIPK